jgi:hypothetical protein
MRTKNGGLITSQKKATAGMTVMVATTLGGDVVITLPPPPLLFIFSLYSRHLCVIWKAPNCATKIKQRV